MTAQWDLPYGRAKYDLELAALENDQLNDWRRYQVGYSPDSHGRMSIETFTVPPLDMSRLRIIRDEGLERDPGSGTFCKLVETVPESKENPTGRVLWMSDTRAEIIEHYPVFDRMAELEAQGNPARRVLIHGMGLGVVVHGALTFPGVKHVDVVELDDDVRELVGGYLVTDPRVTVHSGNAYTYQWPAGSRWDVVWHDIWPDIGDENLPGMRQLLRQFKSRSGWQGCWRMDGCLAMEEKMRQMKNKTLPMSEAWDLLSGRAPWL